MEQTGQLRYLIVNADDFGLTAGINRGIIEARERGIVTSASLMVRYASAAEAADYGRKNPAFSIGLHFDAAEWRFDGGEWKAAYKIIDPHDSGQVRTEFERQLQTFEKLLGRTPTHIDSHQHVHISEPARSVLLEISQRLKIPLRGCSEEIGYQGAFYGQTGKGRPFSEGISFTSLMNLVENVPTGWTELGCHPGYSDELDSVYALEREEELRVLCGAQTRKAVTDSSVLLRSFADFRQGNI